jgi:hypothetical protein
MKITHTENINGKIVAKGKLVFVKSSRKEADENKGDTPIFSTSQGWFNPIIISEIEKVNEYFDKIYFHSKDKITYKVPETTFQEEKDEYTKKILALPEQLSPKTIQDILYCKIKDGDAVYLECQFANGGYSNTNEAPPYELKLNSEGHVTLVGKTNVIEDNKWDELFVKVAKLCWYDESGDAQLSYDQLRNMLEENYNPPTKKQ